jgi:hypothetical protein
MGKSRYNQSRPSVGQVATIKNPSENRESAYRGFRGHETFAFRNREVRNPETARGDKDRPSFRTRVRTRERVGNRGIGVFGHAKVMSHGIAKCDFPTRSEPFIWWTGVSNLGKVGDRRIGVFETTERSQGGIVIRDIPTEVLSRSFRGHVAMIGAIGKGPDGRSSTGPSRIGKSGFSWTSGS